MYNRQVIETVATFVQGIFGIGGEARGILHCVVDNPSHELTEELITPECKGKVIIGGSFVTAGALNRAVEFGAIGIVVGGIDDQDLKDFLGYEIGVAITGSEEKGITLVITEGFGKMKMAQRTFRLLKMHEGKMASINGATQIRAGVMRPEVIVALEEEKVEDVLKDAEKTMGIEVGSPVRIIRQPYFGALGKVTALPPEPTVIETEAKVRILEVELESGEKVVLPRANVELIEE